MDQVDTNAINMEESSDHVSGVESLEKDFDMDCTSMFDLFIAW